MGTYQWLLALHVTAAFLFVGGSVCAGVFNVLAQRSERPSEIAFFLRQVRLALPVIGVGVLGTLVLGLWLVHQADYSLTEGWVWGSLVLWVLSNALGGLGGRTQTQARKLAERLAAEGDAPSAELTALVRDRAANYLSYAAGVATLAILALMIWKPGS